MSFQLNAPFLKTLLSNKHTFIPKITITDRARVSYNTMQDPILLDIPSTVVEVDGIQKNADYIFSVQNINDNNVIFFAPKYEGNYVSGQKFNQIGYILNDNITILDFECDGFTNIDFCYNANCGQAVLVYNAIHIGDTRETETKGVFINTENLLVGEDFTIGVDFEHITSSILDNGKLIVVGYQNLTIYKSIREINLLNTTDIITYNWRHLGDTTLNARCFSNGNEFYHYEIFTSNGATQLRLFNTLYSGFTPVYSNYIYSDIKFYNGTLQGILASDSGKFRLQELKLPNLEVLKTVDFGENITSPQVNTNDYLLCNNTITYNNNGLYTRSLSYETSYVENETEIEIPNERIIQVDLDILNENAKSNTMKVSLNNGDGFFDLTGKNEDGLYYREFVNTERLSNRIVKFYLSDINAVEEGEYKFDIFYTGIMDVPDTGIEGVFNINCVDYLEILKRANCKAKIYSNKQAEDVILDLVKQAGAKEVIFKDALNYTIDKLEVDRRGNVLDVIKTILDKLSFFIYVDCSGNLVVSRRILYKTTAFTFDDVVIQDIRKEGPYMGDARNVVRIITDNEKDLYVEARDEEAIVNMGYESVAEIDYTGLYARPKDTETVEYKTPTYEMLVNALKQIDVGAAEDPKTLNFLKYAGGLFPYHSRYIYYVKTVYENKVRRFLVSCENNFSLIPQPEFVVARCLNGLTSGMNIYSIDTSFLETYKSYPRDADANGVLGVCPGSTLQITTLYPSKEFFKEKEYSELPERTDILDFTRDLKEYLEKDCGIDVDLETENAMAEFVNKYKNTHELFCYVGCFTSAYPHIAGNSYDPKGYFLYAIEKDYTYTDNRMTDVMKDTAGRYTLLVPKDGLEKKFYQFNSDDPEKKFIIPSGGLSLATNTYYGIADYKYHGVYNTTSNSGSDAQTDAERILKQLCRTMEIDNVKLSKPLLFLEPEDIVMLDFNDRFKGYRTVKQMKHSFSFGDKNFYSGQAKLQHAIENIDFFVEEEVENE